MVIKDIKDLKQIIDLCRKTGVDSIKIDNIELQLGPSPIKTTTTPQRRPYTPAGVITEDTQILTDELTADELLFYSATNQDATEQQ